jgi:hypothetical protein
VILHTSQGGIVDSSQGGIGTLSEEEAGEGSTTIPSWKQGSDLQPLALKRKKQNKTTKTNIPAIKMKQKDDKFIFFSRNTRCDTMATVITELSLVLHFRFPEFQHQSSKTVIFLILILKLLL